MRKIFLLITLIMFSARAYSQAVQVVNDKAINGQLKRQAYIKWNDWSPKPTSVTGWIFWRLIWNKYYRGKDRRPYKTGGIMDQDIAEAAWYADMEKKLTDTVQDIAKNEALNFASKSGGALDYAYSLHYKGIFDKLKNQIPNEIMKLQYISPSTYKKVIKDKYYRDYKDEFMDYINERIETVHKTFGEKGDRILAYIDIHRTFENKNEHILNIIRMYKKLIPLEARKTATPVEIREDTDAQIRMRIMKNLAF